MDNFHPSLDYGTARTPFQPTTGKDSGNISEPIVYQTITAQVPYQHKSLEELRLEDYLQAKRFGEFEKLESITAKEEHRDLSFEELRLENHREGKRLRSGNIRTLEEDGDKPRPVMKDQEREKKGSKGGANSMQYFLNGKVDRSAARQPPERQARHHTEKGQNIAPREGFFLDCKSYIYEALACSLDTILRRILPHSDDDSLPTGLHVLANGLAFFIPWFILLHPHSPIPASWNGATIFLICFWLSWLLVLHLNIHYRRLHRKKKGEALRSRIAPRSIFFYPLVFVCSWLFLLLAFAGGWIVAIFVSSDAPLVLIDGKAGTRTGITPVEAVATIISPSATGQKSEDDPLIAPGGLLELQGGVIAAWCSSILVACQLDAELHDPMVTFEGLDSIPRSFGKHWQFMDEKIQNSTAHLSGQEVEAVPLLQISCSPTKHLESCFNWAYQQRDSPPDGNADIKRAFARFLARSTAPRLAKFAVQLLDFDRHVISNMENITHLSEELLYAYAISMPGENASLWQVWWHSFKRRAVMFYQKQHQIPKTTAGEGEGEQGQQWFSCSRVITLGCPHRFRQSLQLYYRIFRYFSPELTPEESVYALHSTVTTILQTTSQTITHATDLTQKAGHLADDFHQKIQESTNDFGVSETEWYLLPLHQAREILSSHRHPHLLRLKHLIAQRFLKNLQQAERGIFEGMRMRKTIRSPSLKGKRLIEDVLRKKFPEVESVWGREGTGSKFVAAGQGLLDGPTRKEGEGGGGKQEDDDMGHMAKPNARRSEEL